MALLTYVRSQWDRVLAWFLVGVGALALVLGWVGVTSTPYTFKMIPYVVSGGLGGLFLLGVGAMLWLSADLRDEWRTLHVLLEGQAGGVERPDASGSAAEATTTPVASPTGDTVPLAVPASAAKRPSRGSAAREGKGRPKRVPT